MDCLCALIGWLDQIRGTSVLQANEFEYAPPTSVDYDDPATGPSQLIWDANFNTAFGPLHEDYLSGPCQVIERAQGSPIVVWLPRAEDLALSESLAREVSGYYVGPPLASKIAYIRKRLEKRRKKL